LRVGIADTLKIWRVKLLVFCFFTLVFFSFWGYQNWFLQHFPVKLWRNEIHEIAALWEGHVMAISSMLGLGFGANGALCACDSLCLRPTVTARPGHNGSRGPLGVTTRHHPSPPVTNRPGLGQGGEGPGGVLRSSLCTLDPTLGAVGKK
jgi:hypothetical protein